ncbi:MAG TPA: type VII toxin-antitoxin system MntA family adenylyltransferase antitoxin [Candidatus Tripitaka californicus]|uniref:type VII toxin-antitoxin system MntA family adenylyltransferase antitoxin n=1 Tax=Candidatus Tripitaka californicus TaxID=3367616 RepID=UPI004026FDDC|nr:nucleotidyltransferase domain-containing protein [Planctomycetota bacterium]
MAETVSIERLKEYFSKRQDVAFAFLFGSQARGVATKLSDVDIAVYFYPKRRHPLEYEKDVFYPSEDEIHTDLERLLKREVELLILNRVSSTITASAIRGIPLVISDWGLYLDFMLAVTRVAEDFMDLVINDYKEKTSVEKRS